MPDMAWRIGLGETAVTAHTDAILNGQETEPFRTQAMDAIVNILHAMKANTESDREEFGADEVSEFDVDKVLLMATIHFNDEQGEAAEEGEEIECGQCDGTGTTDAMGEEEECPVCNGSGTITES